MIHEISKESRNVIFDYILLTILQNKFNKELENTYNTQTSKLLNVINNELQQIKLYFSHSNITVYPPVWNDDGEFLEYPYTVNNIEDRQRFWKAGLKMHVKNKLSEIIRDNRIK